MSTHWVGCEGCGESGWLKPLLSWNLKRLKLSGMDRSITLCGICLDRFKHRKVGYSFIFFSSYLFFFYFYLFFFYFFIFFSFYLFFFSFFIFFSFYLFSFYFFIFFFFFCFPFGNTFLQSTPQLFSLRLNIIWCSPLPLSIWRNIVLFATSCTLQKNF